MEQGIPIGIDSGKTNATQIPTTNGDIIKDVTDKDGDDKIKKLQDEVKKKKEEEDKAKEQKSQDKSRPVSSTPVPGTPW